MPYGENAVQGMKEMDAKFTPGPWRACDRVVVVTVEDHGFGTWIANCAVGGSGGDEQLANSFLIGAAPDLYAVVKRLDAANGLDADHPGYADEMNAIMLLAESALKKAEGRS